jgi:periplasmic divalent cation tolerance protein
MPTSKSKLVIIVTTTTPSAREAESLAEQIVAQELAACVQIVPSITSVYFWQDAVQKDAEHLLLIKTFDEKFGDLEKFIQSNHSYSIPEIVAVPAKDISEAYLEWMSAYLDK